VVIILGLNTTLLPFGIWAGSTTGSGLGPADTYFVTQTSLGTPFQVDSGRLAETRGTTRVIQGYAQLMVSSHITVNKCTDGDSEEQGAYAGAPNLSAGRTSRQRKTG
jgi:predicted outer membrane protein